MSLTPELLPRVEAAWSEVAAAGIAGVKDESFAMVIVRIFRAHDIGLVDPERQRCLVDERVYEGVLHRSHRWERLALAYMAPRDPGAAVWREITRAA